MGKDEIYEILKKENIWFEITEHEAVFNMEEASKVDLPYPEFDAKNIFVRDDKKKNYYLISFKSNKKVNLKEFQERYGTRRLSFASENDLMNIMKLIPGAVTPFGILNDSENKVKFYLDKDFIGNRKIIGVHPNDNTATVWIKVNDLIDIIEKHGTKVNIAQI